jgi:tetratricopeptide (TPR) repeat protein
MKIRLLPVSSGMVLLGLFFIFSGCSSANNAEETSGQLYSEASAFSRRGEYLKAIDCFNKALAIDTLQAASPRVVAALNEKRALEGLTGSYYEALRTTERMEKLPARVLSDSLRNALLTDKSTWLRELGSFRASAASLEKVVSPLPQNLFELASLYRELGEYTKAADIYRRFSGVERDPATRISAYAGLLQCKVAQPQLKIDKAETIAGKIAAESGRVFSMEGDLIPRIQALRAASKSLQLLEKQRRNASFLLFRALTLAEESRNPLLVQMLRLESNAVIVRKPDPFREAAEYFRIKNMQYARASALFMLADSKSIHEDERIPALLQGFSAISYSAPPYPGREFLQLEKNAGRRLTGLLIEKSRIFDLFNATEQVGFIDLQRSMQIYRQKLRVGKDDEAIALEVSKLQHEISGLLQRKADIFFRADGYEKNRAADQAINIKRGRLVELLVKVRSSNPVAAEAMQLAPVTLQSVQEALRQDQAILKPLISDSLCAVMLIGRKQLQIAGSGTGFDSLHTADSALQTINRELAQGYAGSMQQPTAEQEWFSKVFREPLAGSLGVYRHVIVISEDLFPYHILGSVQGSVPEKRYSFLQSIKEFALLSENAKPVSDTSRIFFYRAADAPAAGIHKLFAPGDRVFILWKPYSPVELEAIRQQIALAMQGTVSASEALVSIAETSTAGRETWKYISAYGAD